MASVRSHMSSHPTQRYYIYDDWNENKLTVNRGHYFTAAGGAVGRTGFTPFLKRPKWTAISGTWDASGRTLQSTSTGANVHIGTPSTFITGTWEWDGKIDSIAANYYHFEWFVYIDADNYMQMYIYRFGDTFRLSKTVATVTTAIINGTYTVGTAWHTFKVTRDVAGNWEIFVDGVSKGTVNDTDITSCVQCALGLKQAAASKVHKDNLRLYP